MAKPFPFSAVIGQEAMQSALLINAVDPTIGGVLIRGQKGTAKSTASRALVSLLPSIQIVSGCPYHCDPDKSQELHPECQARLASGKQLPQETIKTPFVDLPLSATEDRLVGTLHLQKTLQSGQRHFEPGLFAAAHRGILYVDEVNLLPDHLVDLLLDTAVSGQNLVEREGLRYCHASRFLLIGSMNPEEGELRPQFLDRFGLCVTIAGVSDHSLRRDIVMQRLSFDRDPDAFFSRYTAQDDVVRQQIVRARQQLNDITIPDEVVDCAVNFATVVKAQGHRAELALVRSARALAAMMDRQSVTCADIHDVAAFALAHRIPGPAVLSQDEVYDRLEGEKGLSFRGTSSSHDNAEDREMGELIDNMAFPGSAAAGSSLFSYLKKKSRTASSVSMNPST